MRALGVKGYLENALAGSSIREVSLDFRDTGPSQPISQSHGRILLGGVDPSLLIHQLFSPKGFIEPLHTSPPAGDRRDNETLKMS